MTPEEILTQAELHDLYDKHEVGLKRASVDGSKDIHTPFCLTCHMPLLLGQDGKYLVGNVLAAAKNISYGSQTYYMLSALDDSKLKANIMAALLMWHTKVNGSENPPMYYANLAKQLDAWSPEFRKVFLDAKGWLAYDYLTHYDMDAEMRAAALSIKDAHLAYNMALFIDQEPRQDTYDSLKGSKHEADFKRWAGYKKFAHITLKY